MADMRWLESERIKGQGNRKWRLFACACCRRVWQRITEERWRKVIEVAERHSDGLATKAEATKVIAAAGDPEGVWQTAAWWLANTVLFLTTWGVERASRRAALTLESAGGERAYHAELAPQARLFGDIFGHFPVTSERWHWIPATLDPGCRTPTAITVAQAAYDERTLPSGELDGARLCILADALEEAGCTSAEILGHLRGEGPHVRGCWAVDLVLGRRWVGGQADDDETVGMEIGMEKGKLEQARESVRLVLGRFGAIPDDLARRIDALEDLDKLKAAISNAARVTKLEDFQP